MRVVLLLIISVFIFNTTHSQSFSDYENLIKKNKNFYHEQINIWMKAYSYIYHIKSWEIKDLQINVRPEEGIILYSKNELDKFSVNEKDSIYFNNWNDNIFIVTLPIIYNDNSKSDFNLWMQPNGLLYPFGKEIKIWLESDQKPLYLTKP